MSFNSCEASPEKNLTLIEETTKYLWVIFSPIIFIVGMVANILAIIVLHRIQQHTVSVGAVYRIVLAISDMTILCTGLSRYWILYLFDYDIRGHSDAGCKINLFVIYVSMHYSSWILVSMTVQRCLVVYNPLRFKNMWTVKVSRIQLVLLFVFLSLIDCHYFFTNGIINCKCESLSNEIFNFEEHYFVFIDLAILCLIPFVIMFAGNLYFLKNMRTVREVRRSLTEGQRNTLTRRQNTRLIMKMTWLFLFTTFPICTQMIADSFIEDFDKEKSLAKAVCYLSQYFGVSINICIYITNDRRFRQQLKSLFGLKNTFSRKDTNSSQSQRTFTASSRYQANSKKSSVKAASSGSATDKMDQLSRMDRNKETFRTNPSTDDDDDRFLSTHM